jgi:TetR/AcrR family transcriptional regulator
MKKASANGEERIRDAERSRSALLSAAEELFAERGFAATSLGDVASRAGLSRGTPNYFFGSKDALYAAVLERAFSEREQATREAFQPLIRWAVAESPGSLKKALTGAVAGYMDFLASRPSFLRLIQWEELTGAARLRAVERDSAAIEEAFAALRGVARRRGLNSFRVADAVTLCVSLVFFPLSAQATFMTAIERDLDDPATYRQHISLVVDQILHLIGGPRQRRA